MSQSDTLNLIRFIPADDTVAKGVVLYFHGNTGNVEYFADAVDIFLKNNYEVWMPDYPGFGKTRGEISEKTLNEEAYQVKRLANQYFPDSNIIIYGRSFGTGVAANLASSVKSIHQLILESPFYSIPALYSSYLPIYPMKSMAQFQFPIYDFLNDVNCPITVFHGNKDNVIPIKSSYKLKAEQKEKLRLVVIDGAGHNDVNDNQEYIKVMNELLK